ncbi:Thioredoxin domain containing protein [Asbolus verrucosus]|uniref:Thioredoxin n=1 Tax=Asbolus verrucosus TaxID=1661398 RepID=A0A482VU03_ASBVE|nr:Thioredoxin domain containing protein [Asbolus verrucosus]
MKKFVRNITSSSNLHKLITIKNNDEFLSKVMNSENPVIVNFHAEWCEPCHILTPKMKELVEHKDNIDLAIVDVENHAELVHTFEVKAVPAVIAVKNGLVVDKFIGLVDTSMIENLINKLDKKI